MKLFKPFKHKMADQEVTFLSDIGLPLTDCMKYQVTNEEFLCAIPLLENGDTSPMEEIKILKEGYFDQNILEELNSRFD